MSQLKSQAKTVATIRLVGGDPALDFVNTVDAWRDRWGPDLLTSYGDLILWAERVRLIDTDLAADLRRQAKVAPAEAQAALAQAKTLRASLRELFLAESDGSAIRTEDLGRLNAVLAQANQRRQLRFIAGAVQWGWRENEGFDAILHRIAIAAADLFTSRDSRRGVRECHGVNCGWLFLDTSRGGRRQWCSEESCGTHMRVRRFREKGDAES